MEYSRNHKGETVGFLHKGSWSGVPKCAKYPLLAIARLSYYGLVLGILQDFLKFLGKSQNYFFKNLDWLFFLDIAKSYYYTP